MDPEAIQILRDIRDAVQRTNDKVDQTVDRLDQTVDRLDQTVDRLDQTVDRLDQHTIELQHLNSRVGSVETVLLNLAEQQRFTVRYLRTLTERDHRLEHEVDGLRIRVDRIEARLGPE